MTIPAPEVRYATSTTHSRGYYRAVIVALLDGLKHKLTDRDIASNLNSLNLKSPTGAAWDGERVKGTLKRIRHHARMPTKFYSAMLEAVFWGELTQAEVLPLLLPRTRQGSM